MELESGRVLPGDVVDLSPTAVSPPMPALPTRSVSGRDANKSPLVPLYTIEGSSNDAASI